MYIKKELVDIEISVIRKLAFKMKEYDNGINLTIGEPGDDVPLKVKEYMQEQIMNKYGYSPPGGLLELRQKYAEFYNKYFDANYSLEECCVNNGATEAISSFFSAVIEKGDEVILPLPVYPGYEPNILIEGGKPVFINNKENDYKITAELLEKYITPKTKAIVLTYPNNPLGTILSLEEMDKIAKLIEKNNIYLVSDEIYASLTFEKYYSFARYHHLKNKIVVISGMSKSHSMTAYRIGYTLTHKDLLFQLLKMSQFKITGVNTIAQLGSIKALELYPTREEVIKENKEKIDYLLKELNELGFKCYKPQGAFYIFADYTNISNKNSYDFVIDLIDKVQVGVVPSIAFKVEGAVRISVNKDMNELKEFIKRLKEYINKYC